MAYWAVDAPVAKHGAYTTGMRALRGTSFGDALERAAAIAAATYQAKANASQAVTTHPEILDTEANGGNLHDVLPHTVKFASHSRVADREAIKAGWTEAARLAFLARAQRIDPRTRKP